MVRELAQLVIARALTAMRNTDFNEAQAKAIHQRRQPIVGYLHRLEARMNELDFPADDKLLVLVKSAHQALHRVLIEAHYLSCSRGFA